MSYSISQSIFLLRLIVSLDRFKPNIFALVIGIDAYDSTVESGPLKKAFADSNNIKDWLAKLAVPESQIRVLQNENATRDAIIDSLGKLSKDKRIQRGDPILIYYAGHGSEADAPKKWNWDTPKIQTILPHDYGRKDSTGRVIQGIPDRTLGFLLSEISREKGNNIVRIDLSRIRSIMLTLMQTVILDCCHSGSGTRSGLKARGVPYKGIIPDNLDEDIMTRGARGIGVHDRFRDAGCRSHVLLAACASYETAYEDRHSGLFTRALLDAFEGVDMTKTTNIDLVKSIDLKNQTPQCEGYHRSRLLFSGKVSNSTLVYPAFWKSSKFTVEAGAFHGIQKGCKFGIWKSEDDLRRQKPHATVVTVDMVYAFRSIANNVNGAILPNRKSLHTHTTPPSFFAQILDNPQRVLRVHVPDAIQKMECFKTMFDETKHRPPLKIDTLANEAQASDQEIRYTILPDADDLYEALRHLSHYFYHRNRVGRSNPRVGATKEVQATLASQVKIAMFTLKETDDGEGYKRDKEVILPTDGSTVELIVERESEGSLYGFEITNTSKFDVFPYLFYFNSSDFSVGTLFKPIAETRSSAQVPTPLPAGHSLRIGYGSEGGEAVELAVSGDMHFERGCFRLFIPTQYADLSFMEQAGIPHGIERGVKLVPPSVGAFWDFINIPTILRKEGTTLPFTIGKEAATPTFMIGIIGSRRNGKATVCGPSGSLTPPESESSLIKEYNITIPDTNGSQFECTLVDLPAFEDIHIHNQAATLKELAAWLDTQYREGRELASLIWCYDISSPSSDLDKLNLDLIKDLTGEEMFKNVVVLTTSWNDGEKVGTNKVAHMSSLAARISPLQRHETHEQRLKTQELDFKPLVDGKAKFKRFGVFSGPEMAKQAGISNPLTVLQAVAENTPVIPRAQREIFETNTLSKTTAGKRLRKRLEKEIEAEESVLLCLRRELEDIDRVGIASI
ncbi:hypothetical protein H1R20_g13657, partial [Candolleomyces eurysporus]